MVKNLQVFSSDAGIKKALVHSIISTMKKEFNLTISFLSISFIKSNELRQINKSFLKHDYNTDVITFDYSKKKNEIDAEILISMDDARKNAKKFKDAKSKKTMKKEENKLINKFNFTLLASK